MAKPTGRGGWRDRSTSYLAAIAAVVLVVVLVDRDGRRLSHRAQPRRILQEDDHADDTRPAARPRPPG